MLTESTTPRNRPDDQNRQFWLASVGCKVNQYDANAVACLLRGQGWRQAHAPRDAQLSIIMTCCVTRTAMRKTRQAVARACRGSPCAAVAVLGCYSDYDAQRIDNLLLKLGLPQGRRMIAGHHDGLPERLRRFADNLPAGGPAASADPTACSAALLDGNRHDVCMSEACQGNLPATSTPATIKARRGRAVKADPALATTLCGIDRFAFRQRAFVKVQDGCDAFCAYCIVPFTRCRLSSRSIDQIEAECRTLVEAGHREIVLSGVFLGAFGRRTALRRNWPAGEPARLPELAARIADVPGLWRVRLSSLEPGDLSDDLLDVCRSRAALAPHFHLPLQSGSAGILKRMNRQYAPQDYRDAIERLRSALDRPAITTDVIVGFPGERDEDFQATLEMAQFAGFSKIHAFPFSPVEPTAAWGWRGEAPPPSIVRLRMAELASLEAELAERYRGQFVGEVLEGLVEAPRQGRDGLRRAMTDRYFRISFQPTPGQAEDLTGQVVRLRVSGASSRDVQGVPVEALRLGQ